MMDVPDWRKPRRSFSCGNCAEAGTCRTGPASGVAVRDSKDASGPVLRFGAAAWVAFTASVKSGGPA